jgi:hypothetical protein
MTSPAWYFGTREEFLATSKDSIADQLAGRAASESLEIESYQNQEWRTSIDLLQKALDERVPILREALQSPQGQLIRHVILEFDFRRRGLRMDCVLLADGVLFVVEFKRTKLQASDRDQAMTYAINLLEFHAATQTLSQGPDGIIVVPVLTLTEGHLKRKPYWPGLGGHSWAAAADRPLESDAHSLVEVFQLAFENRRSNRQIDRAEWLRSPFRPSSSILDATLSLYGNHDVSAISEHAAPAAQIKSSVAEIRDVIEKILSEKRYHVVFLSGAPGAGKTLVGLELVLRGNHAGESVFVTGNAPLVEVLNKALAQSFRSQSKSSVSWAHTGYRREDARFVTSTANYKIVKAHNFLGKRTESHRQEDGRVLVFDEAQRTYEMGKMVLREKLPDHEADLILETQNAYPTGGAVIVALIGHNQAINGGEMGIQAWLDAIERKGWSFSISDLTLELAEIKDASRWADHKRRWQLQNGHLKQSMRYYRNAEVEQWAGCVLEGDTSGACIATNKLDQGSDCIWITRSLSAARSWAKKQTVGTQRCGLIASGQARRLAAEGLFVELKPSIADWMLAPSSDVRSSNSLETVQNQFQIQGLELDYCIVCWDADLRRENGEWASYKLSGSRWQKDALLDVAKNCYRVLLTRARKGMVIFVPTGDLSGDDVTRSAEFYDGIWEFLVSCGARKLGSK